MRGNSNYWKRKGYKRIPGKFDKRKVFWEKGKNLYKLKNGKMVFSHSYLR